MRAKYTYYLLFIFILFLPQCIIAQLGGTIINVDFGQGKPNLGPPLPLKYTDFKYSGDSCGTPGSYSVINDLYICPAYRMGRLIDNTIASDYGYMMVVNDTPSLKTRLLYIDTLKESLCPETLYQFSAYFLNTAIPNRCGPNSGVHMPSFTFKVETTSGQLIAYAQTGPLPYDYSTTYIPKFHNHGITFHPPAGVNELVIKIEDDATTVTGCGYSYAVDDIQLTAVGPKSSITFSDAIGLELIRTVCYQDNKTISMTGTVDAFYSNMKLQWQQSIDKGQTWTDIPGATAFQYTKTFSTPDTFLFRLSAGEATTMANPNCRVVSNVLTVRVTGKPTGYSISSNAPVCAGNILQFNATGATSYEWFGPNGFYDNVYYAHIYHTQLSDSGMYYVHIISAGNCYALDSIYVKIIGTHDVRAWPDTAICKGNPVQLMTTSGIKYSWSPATGLSNATIQNPVANPDVSTTYTVSVTDAYGCTSSSAASLTVKNSIPVKARIEGTPYLCLPYDSASFKDASSGYIVKRNWVFGNGQTDTSNVPREQYYSMTGAGVFRVVLAVMDSAGCADTAYHEVKAVNNCYIAVPNAFTPNNDGLNDYLYPLNAYKASNLLFRVYNRYGQLVFETRDWSRKWNGKVNGIPQPTGVYVWMLDYTDPANRKVSLKGTTVLIR